MLTLGEVLALCRRSAGVVDRLPLSPGLRARLDAAAAEQGEEPGALVLFAVADFAAEADAADWSSLMARLRDAPDPGLRGLEFMVERSLRTPPPPLTASSEP